MKLANPLKGLSAEAIAGTCDYCLKFHICTRLSGTTGKRWCRDCWNEYVRKT